MKLSFSPILIILFANLIYHVSQKKLSDVPSPFVLLCVAYVVSFALSLFMGILTKKTGTTLLLTKEMWFWIVLLGIGILGIELGFFWAYQQGWPLNRTALFSHVSLTLLLIPIGIFAYGEPISVKRILGFLLALFGLILLH